MTFAGILRTSAEGFAGFCTRLQRGFARICGLLRHRPGTPGQIAQETETEVSLGLMEAAANAPGGPTDEQRIFLSQSAVGMRNRVGVLLGIPHRTLPQERELHTIQRELARIEGRAAPTSRSMNLLSALPSFTPAHLSLLGLAFAIPALFGGWQTLQLWGARAETAAARRAAIHNAEAARSWETHAHLYEQATADAQAAAHITTQTLEAERRRVAAAAARERRRQIEIANVNAGADPPNWDSSLRNDPAPEDQSGAATPAADRHSS